MFVRKEYDQNNCVMQVKQAVSKRISTMATKVKVNENDNRVLDIFIRDRRAFGAYEIARQASDKEKTL